jgi:hypothetical protein
MKHSILLCAITCGIASLSFASRAEISSAASMAREISTIRIFNEPLVPIGSEPVEAETRELLAAINHLRQNNPGEGFGALEAFLERHTNSAWNLSIRTHLGKYYKDRGQVSRALRHWEKAWEQGRAIEDGPGKRLADYTLVHWTRALASLGRVDTLDRLFTETAGRTLDRGPLQQIFNATKEALMVMHFDSSVAFRCGTHALSAVAGRIGCNPNSKLFKVASPRTGFSLNALASIAAEAGLPLVAAKRTAGDQLPVPSVIHWKENHYAALIDRRKGACLVKDPTSHQAQWMSEKAINSEASGYFLLLATNLGSSFSALDTTESSTVFGKGYDSYMREDGAQQCAGFGGSVAVAGVALVVLVAGGALAGAEAVSAAAHLRRQACCG